MHNFLTFGGQIHSYFYLNLNFNLIPIVSFQSTHDYQLPYMNCVVHKKVLHFDQIFMLRSTESVQEGYKHTLGVSKVNHFYEL